MSHLTLKDLHRSPTTKGSPTGTLWRGHHHLNSCCHPKLKLPTDFTPSNLIPSSLDLSWWLYQQKILRLRAVFGALKVFRMDGALGSMIVFCACLEVDPKKSHKTGHRGLVGVLGESWLQRLLYTVEVYLHWFSIPSFKPSPSVQPRLFKTHLSD